jgi:hypothetical protein
MWNKISNIVAAFFIGIFVSLSGGFLQAAYFRFIVRIPWGLILYLVIFLGAILYIRKTTRTRIAVVGFSLGWLLIALLMSIKLRAGDLVLTNNLGAKIYLLGSVIILSTLASLPIKKIK